MGDGTSSAQRHVTRDELEEAVSNLSRGINLVVCALVLELERQQLISGERFATTLEEVASHFETNPDQQTAVMLARGMAQCVREREQAS
jgi:hypothetical protein